MGRGTRHELVGVLLGDESFPILCVPDGGQWRLDLPGRYRHLLGQRVRVIGWRSEFDMLDVDRIMPA